MIQRIIQFIIDVLNFMIMLIIKLITFGGRVLRRWLIGMFDWFTQQWNGPISTMNTWFYEELAIAIAGILIAGVVIVVLVGRRDKKLKEKNVSDKTKR